MKVLFLLLTYPENPDSVSSLYVSLVREFAKRGHDVAVVCPSEKGEPTELKKSYGVDVLRVKTLQIFNVHPIIKGLATLTIPLTFKRAIKKHLGNRHFDIVLTPTPPITFIDIVVWLKKHQKDIISYLILRDIFPQNAKDLGMIKSKPVFEYFRKKERKLYKYSDVIGCMSQGNIDFVKKHNPEVAPGKLCLLPNWQTLKDTPGRDEAIKEKYGVGGKYIVIFGGNIGEPQKVENIVTLAELYRQNKDIVFIVLGNGAKKKYLEKLVADGSLDNVIIKDFIPAQDYLHLVSSADVGLISLSELFTIPNIPSKTLSYFIAKVPILAAIDANTDYGKILEESGAGLWSVTGDTESYKKNFDTLYQDASLRKRMGENGHKYFKEHLTTELAYETILSQINNKS